MSTPSKLDLVFAGPILRRIWVLSLATGNGRWYVGGECSVVFCCMIVVLLTGYWESRPCSCASRSSNHSAISRWPLNAAWSFAVQPLRSHVAESAPNCVSILTVWMQPSALATISGVRHSSVSGVFRSFPGSEDFATISSKSLWQPYWAARYSVVGTFILSSSSVDRRCWAVWGSPWWENRVMAWFNAPRITSFEQVTSPTVAIRLQKSVKAWVVS